MTEEDQYGWLLSYLFLYGATIEKRATDSDVLQKLERTFGDSHLAPHYSGRLSSLHLTHSESQRIYRDKRPYVPSMQPLQRVVTHVLHGG